MSELYLRLLDRILTPVLLLLAVVLLMRGHNEPGGGFIAGLMVATAFQLQILSIGKAQVERRVGAFLQPAMGIGLVMAVIAGAIGVLYGGFFKGAWWSFEIGTVHLDIGTPVIFDLGVFLVVLSVVTIYLLGLSEEHEITPHDMMSREIGTNRMTGTQGR